MDDILITKNTVGQFIAEATKPAIWIEICVQIRDDAQRDLIDEAIADSIFWEWIDG